MPIEVLCSTCQRKYRIAARMAGHRVKCRACGNIFLAVPTSDLDDTAVEAPAIDDAQPQPTPAAIAAQGPNTLADIISRTAAIAPAGPADTPADPDTPEGDLDILQSMSSIGDIQAIAQQQSSIDLDGTARPAAAPANHSPDPWLSAIVSFAADPIPIIYKLLLLLLLLVLSVWSFFQDAAVPIGITAFVFVAFVLAALTILGVVVRVARESAITQQTPSVILHRHRKDVFRGLIRIGGLVALTVIVCFLFPGLQNIGKVLPLENWIWPRTAEQWVKAWDGQTYTREATDAIRPTPSPTTPRPGVDHAIADADTAQGPADHAVTVTVTRSPSGAQAPAPVQHVSEPAMIRPLNAATNTPPGSPAAGTITRSNQAWPPDALGQCAAQLPLQLSDQVIAAADSTGAMSIPSVLVRQQDGNCVISQIDPVSLQLTTLTQINSAPMVQQYALSPDGHVLLRRSLQSIEAFDLSAHQQQATPMSTTALAEPNAAYQILGFTTPDHFVLRIQAGRSVRLAIVDDHTGQLDNDSIILPTHAPGAVAISNDARHLAVISVDPATPELQLRDLPGGQIARRVPLPDVDGQSVRALSFSRDGTRLAAAVLLPDQVQVIGWNATSGAMLFRHVLPAAHELTVAPGSFRGSALAWTPDTTALLLFGTVAVDPQTGRFVGDLAPAAANASLSHVAAPQQYLVQQLDSVGSPSLFAVNLDPATLAQRLTAARADGPLRLAASPLAHPIWSSPAQALRQESSEALSAVTTPDPLWPSVQPLLNRPLPLGAPSSEILAVMFSRPQQAIVVVHRQAADPESAWHTLHAQPAVLERYNLLDGQSLGRVSIPPGSTLLGITPDGSLALTGIPVPGESGASDSAAATVTPSALAPSLTRAGPVNAAIGNDDNDDAARSARFARRYAAASPILRRHAGKLSLPHQAAAASPSSASPPSPSPAANAPVEHVERLDVWSLADGQHVTGLVPFAAMPQGHRDVRWAALIDAQSLLTLSADGMLTRWAVDQRMPAWSLQPIAGLPVLSPARQYVVIRTPHGLRALDIRTGLVQFDLPLPPQRVQIDDGGQFTTDGKLLAMGSPAGLSTWSMVAPRSPASIDVPGAQTIGFCTDKYLFAGDQIVDIAAAKPVFRYQVHQGRHLYDSPDNRHWYIANGADGQANLCAMALPTASDLDLIAQGGTRPNLMAKGQKLAVVADVEGFSSVVSTALAARLQQQGSIIAPDAPAAVHVIASKVSTGQQVSIQVGNETDTAPYDVYDCHLSVVGKSGKTLWAGPVTRVEPSADSLPAAIRPDETVPQRFSRGLVENVCQWAASTDLPAYVPAEGEGRTQCPEAELGVGTIKPVAPTSPTPAAPAPTAAAEAAPPSTPPAAPSNPPGNPPRHRFINSRPPNTNPDSSIFQVPQ